MADRFSNGINMTLEELTLAHIKARTEEVGDCWIWQQGATNGYPQMKVQGRCCKLVRRMVVEIEGRPAEPRQPVVVTCGEALCVNPAHLKATSASDAAKRAAKKGAWQGKARAAKIAKTRRRSNVNKKLDIDKAREIRMSPESGPVLAARYGVDRSLISRIKRGTDWKDYANPYAALGAR